MSVIMPIARKPTEKSKVFCPVLMKESDCEFTKGRYCGKSLPERLECAKVLDVPSIYNLIPTGSFLYKFIEYCNKITDAPDIFAFGAGLTAISTVLQKKVYMTWAGSRLYTNTYILLVMKSGGRKSTILKVAKKMLKKSENERGSLVFPSDITPEAFYMVAQNRPYESFFHGEFGGWFKSLDRNYNKGFKEFLTDAFDGFSQKKLIKWPNGGGNFIALMNPLLIS